MLVLTATVVLAACSLPRGAALQSEILREENADIPSFEVIPVTRDIVPVLADWPVTGWSGSYRWLAAGRGPGSPIIRRADMVNLVIWDSQDNSLLTTPGQKNIVLEPMEVSASGTIFVPYVGEVVVSGATPQEARARVQDALVDIVPSAQVQLSIEQGAENSVDLVSGVASPGSYPLPSRDYTILSALAAGGGIIGSLENPLVRLIRGSDAYEIRADRLFADASHNVLLQGGDKIVVQEDDRHFTALGAAGTEDLIPFPAEELSALEAVSLMGGLSDQRADPEGVLVLREFPPEVVGKSPGPTHPQVIFTFNLTTADGLFAARNFQINPGDTVLATESPVTKAQTIFDLFGSIFGLTRQATIVAE
ncbi:MAG: polysaccharide biosynthesis/export family protein [Rhodosalinus sp.]